MTKAKWLRVVWFLGVALAGVGVDVYHYALAPEWWPSYIEMPGAWMIITGFAIMAVTFYGIYSMLKED